MLIGLGARGLFFMVGACFFVTKLVLSCLNKDIEYGSVT